MLYACSESFVNCNNFQHQARELLQTCEDSKSIINLQQLESTSGTPPFLLSFSVVNVPFILGRFAHASCKPSGEFITQRMLAAY